MYSVSLPPRIEVDVRERLDGMIPFAPLYLGAPLANQVLLETTTTLGNWFLGPDIDSRPRLIAYGVITPY